MPESLFDEFESYDCGFLLLPKDLQFNTNNLIYLAVAYDDDYEEDYIGSGMGCLAFVSETYSLQELHTSSMQVVSFGFSNFF